MGDRKITVRLAAAGLLSIAAAAVAWQLRPHSPSLAVLVLLACSAPLLAQVGSAAPGRPTSALAAAGGLCLGVLGVVQAARIDGLTLVTMGFSWKQVATGAATQLSPYALVAAGLLLVLAAAAAWSRDRAIGLLVVVLTLCLSAALAVALAASSAASLRFRGGTVDRTVTSAAALVTVSGLLLLLVAAARRSSPATQSANPAPAVRRRSGAMRMTVLAAVVGVLAVGGLWAHQLTGGQELNTLFPDPALSACIGTEIGDGPSTPGAAGGRASQRELNSIVTLTCNGERAGAGGRISSLAGLENLPNLTVLGLANNAIADLTPLRAVPGLIDVKLTGNQVTRLDGLEALTGLQDLGLSSNQISDLTPLAGLTSLRALGLTQNAISDLTPLAGLTSLEQLDAGDNRIASIAPLGGLAVLDRLNVSRNRITSDALPVSLPALTMLNIEGNRLRDLTWAAGYPKVDELWLGGNPITDVSPLMKMAALQGVDLAGVDSTKITGIQDLASTGVYVGGMASGREPSAGSGSQALTGDGA